MRVLVACEFSGIVREAFKAAGHDAWSCDLLPTEIPGQHIEGDAIEVLTREAWDLVIAHPPCTFLAVSGARLSSRGMFGHGETKATCLWLKGLPKLQPTKLVEGRLGRVWREPPSPDRWKNRSRTYPGIAAAMASQWR